MKHIFIINPVAGTGKARDYFMPRIVEELERLDADYKMHITTKAGDAIRFVKRLCSLRKDFSQTLRFYACGGDGTLNEVLNGAYGYANVEIACIPAGSGNDFIRNFGDEKAFRNIKAQLEGYAVSVDLIACNLDRHTRYYGINLVNTGLDCDVVEYMEEVKRLRLLNGRMAYIYGAFRAFLSLKSYPLTIEADEEKIFDGVATLLAIGNGTTYGGGFRATPKAKVDDGLMDVCLVRRIDHIKFLKLIGDYKKGEHIKIGKKDSAVSYRNARKLTVRSEEPILVSIDGELKEVRELQAYLLPKAVRFVVPENGYE